MQLTNAVIDRTRQSLQRCMKNPAFFSRFYQIFIAASPEVQEKLRNTSIDRQSVMLKGSMHIMLLFAAGQLADGAVMQKLAQVHDHQHRDIKPHLYNIWLESMVAAVRECDPECTPDLETAWRLTMQPGIDYMVGHYSG